MIFSSYDVHRGKTTIMPYANSEGPDERAHPSSLIFTFSVRWYVLEYPLEL